MELNILDHLFFLLIAVALPIHGALIIGKLARRIRAGETHLRMDLYRSIVREEWILTAVLVAMWFGSGRDAGSLGLGFATGTWAWVGYGLALSICVLLAVQLVKTTSSPKGHETFRKQVGELDFILPQSAAELSAFNRVSLTAGICEEVIFRGFGIAYLVALLGLPLWAAVLVSSFVFGLAHSYQGPLGALRAGSLGLILATLYALTGALWAPIVVHAVMDLTSGRMGYEVFRPEENGETPAIAG